jgi:phage minor structural protein
MIIYFCDRELNILGHASTTLPGGIRISQDKTTEDVESGVNAFECILTWDDDTRAELEQGIVAGNYILKQSDTKYDSLYQIVETESDTKEQEISLYAEDAGLDLLNTLCPATTLQNKTMLQMLQTFMPSDWTISIWDAPSGTRSNEWEGESTCTERVRSVVGLWDCELYYTFRVEGLQVREKILNVVQKRGRQEAIPQLRLNYDIDRIVTRTSIADLVTALNVTGGTPEGSDTPINLKNYDYTYTDPVTGDLYQVDKNSGQMRNLTAMDRWSSALDADGLWVGSYTFDTTDKLVLAGQARAELQRRCYPAVNYDVDFAKLPEDAKIGDRVNIIDDDGGLYLEARLLQIETCEADDTKTATIGEYLLKSSGISDMVQALAQEVSALGDIESTYTWVAYADDNQGTGISLNPAGKTYIGIAVNKTTSVVDISDPSVFSWLPLDQSSIVALSAEITSSGGTLFIDTTVATTLTAHIYANGSELTAQQIADIGVIRWYNADDMTTVLATGQTYTLTQAMNISAINITARLEVTTT